jgi:2-polyprenyl-3-methyl-5-hydroxy-6-metoxy-1,4-benzoquinol methylase
MDLTRYHKSTYDKVASEYEERIVINRQTIETVLPRLMGWIKKKEKALDIGCAVGLHMKMLENLGFNVTGIDVSDEMVKYAKKRNPFSRVILGDFLDVDFGEKYDLIWALAFIHLYPKKEISKILDKINFLLEEGGICLLTTTKAEKSEEGFFEKKDYNKKVKRFRKFWTKEELEKELRNSFEILDYFERVDGKNKHWMLFVIKRK